MIKKEHITILVWVIFLHLLIATPGFVATAQYTYDNLNRLVQVQSEDGTTIQYTYDAVGNRLTQEVTAFSQMLSLPGGAPSFLTGEGLEIPADAPTLQNLRAPSGTN